MRRETGDQQRGGFPALHPARFGCGLRQTAKSEIGNELSLLKSAATGLTHGRALLLGNGKSRPGFPQRLWYYSRQFVVLHHGAEESCQDRKSTRLNSQSRQYLLFLPTRRSSDLIAFGQRKKPPRFPAAALVLFPPICCIAPRRGRIVSRSEEHTSELPVTPISTLSPYTPLFRSHCFWATEKAAPVSRGGFVIIPANLLYCTTARKNRV